MSVKRIVLLPIAFLLFSLSGFGQDAPNIIYIVDEIPVIDDPERGNEVNEADIADMNVVKEKDSLMAYGFEKFDAAIFLFTKEYRKRSDEIKKIPSSLQMKRIDDIWYYNNEIYSGKFIDYYYSGRIQGEGTMKNGKLEGLRKMYFQNGKISVERYYTNAIPNGSEKEYYEDGSLKQKGEFVSGKEDGIWEAYFPNGQPKQQTNFKMGILEGKSTKYYSTGKILSVITGHNGKVTPDKRFEKISELMRKSNESNESGDSKAAIKYCTKAIEIDSAYAQAYFSRGTIKLNDMQFDDAIADFDKALTIEPMMEFALTNRAFARIRRYQFGDSKKLMKNSEVTVLASKKNVEISGTEKEKICRDLEQAIFLGDKADMVLDAKIEYCK